MRYTYCDIRKFIDNIKNVIVLIDDNNGLFWYDFGLFAIKYLIQCWRKIIKFWSEKTIMTRLEDMDSIYKIATKKDKIYMRGR